MLKINKEKIEKLYKDKNNPKYYVEELEKLYTYCEANKDRLTKEEEKILKKAIANTKFDIVSYKTPPILSDAVDFFKRGYEETEEKYIDDIFSKDLAALSIPIPMREEVRQEKLSKKEKKETLEKEKAANKATDKKYILECEIQIDKLKLFLKENNEKLSKNEIKETKKKIRALQRNIFSAKHPNIDFTFSLLRDIFGIADEISESSECDFDKLNEDEKITVSAIGILMESPVASLYAMERILDEKQKTNKNDLYN